MKIFVNDNYMCNTPNHCVPRLGLKLDSVPGRINSTIIDGSPRICIGSCFELCGTGHSASNIHFTNF